ncbi:hypothetical protein Lal_00024049 [Lupinus albus]|nr:hypothetical protein Lal_00024049 [Lupinus albus]
MVKSESLALAISIYKYFPHQQNSISKHLEILHCHASSNPRPSPVPAMTHKVQLPLEQSSELWQSGALYICPIFTYIAGLKRRQFNARGSHLLWSGKCRRMLPFSAKLVCFPVVMY